MILPLLGLVLCYAAIAQAADPPKEIAGVVLGENIQKFRDRLADESGSPVRSQEYLVEAVLKPVDGFKVGYVYYGACSNPGRIVKIKLKFDRSDKDFFDKLLALYKKRFGEPDEYKGDVFRAHVAWKWSFSDKAGNRTSLILQNAGDDLDEDYTTGNSVKLAVTNLIDQERQCSETKEEGKAATNGSSKENTGPVNFDMLIPR
jgi:hypothetical protein